MKNKKETLESYGKEENNSSIFLLEYNKKFNNMYTKED